MKFWGAVAEEHMAIRCRFFYIFVLFEGDDIELSDGMDFILCLGHFVNSKLLFTE